MTSKPHSPAIESVSDHESSPSIEQAMRADQARLLQLRDRAQTDAFQARLLESVRLRQAREAAPLRLEYPEELPISAHREQLLNLIREHQVIVVCGETGSGKSTQLPKLCLEAGRGRAAMIGHTQPRRLAARSIATRLAQELDVRLGDEVGYQVRFGDQTTPRTLVKQMTDGILLSETQSDRSLDQYDAIIIDEAHERSLNIDFLLGYLRQLLERRPDLRVIVTSATIDAERFAEHFANPAGPAPIVTVEGRGYPVELRYLPWDDIDVGGRRGYDLAGHVIAGLDSVGPRAGDALVFLPTERDIREVSHRVAGHYAQLGLRDRVDMLPLYARLPQSEQQRIFNPAGNKRRIIFSTNVAESSLTVPGIHCVIDTGTARISRYSPRSKLQRLPIEPVSQASANQRAGRCGRVGPGICVRLFSTDDYDARDRFTTPEIRRTNLAAVILRTKTLKLGSLEQFPLLDPPRPEAIREGLRTLAELGAVDSDGELTEIGWQLGRMPVDPRVGRMILAAADQGVLPELLPIAAALEVQDPRDRPPEKRQAADEAHQPFADPRSDFLGYLKLWRYYEEMRAECGRSKLDRVLRKQFLSPNRMREWSDTYRQLRELAATTLTGERSLSKSIGPVRFAEDPDEVIDRERSDSLHQALLTGLLSGVAMAAEKNDYQGTGGLTLSLWPGSAVFETKPKWIMAAELVETTRQYARTVAKIQPHWIEHVGGHLIKRSYSDPHWSDKGNGAFCYERQSLFGLPVVARRRVPLPPIDPATARDLLIAEGLVEEKLTTTARFVRHNRRLCRAIEQLAAKTRRRELVIDPADLSAFYRVRVPLDVSDRGRLEKWDRLVVSPDWETSLRDAASVSQWIASPPPPSGDDETPYLRPEDLVDTDVNAITDADFPDQLVIGSTRLPLDYHFEPGSERDGITIRIHQSALAQVSDERLGWLVPGLLEVKIVALIKSLPKRIRRNLVPAADVANKIADQLRDQWGRVAFLPAVCAAMSTHAEVPVTAADFQAEKLDRSLQFLIDVVDDSGQSVARGREIEPLKQRLGAQVEAEEEQPNSLATESWSRESIRTFEIDELPREVIRRRGGIEVAQYPGLVDLGDAVGTRLFSNEALADAAMRIGTTRLYAIVEQRELRSQVRHLPSLHSAQLRLAGAILNSSIEAAMVDLLARVAFVEGQPLIRSQAEFERRREDRMQRISLAAQELAGWLETFSEHFFSARREAEELSGGRFSDTVSDVRQQVEWLVFDGFLHIAPWTRLKHYPRYFAAITYRLDKLRSGAAQRDGEHAATVARLWDRWLDAHEAAEQTPAARAGDEFRWLVEELRVSLFAQPLGTFVKVSPQRCEKLLSDVVTS